MSLRWIGRLIVAFCFALGVSTPVLADDVSGSINGFVYSGGIRGPYVTPIKHATVFVYSWDNSAPVAGRVTDGTGFFSFLGLLPGRYYILARATGYHFYCPRKLVIIPGGLSRVNLSLDEKALLVRCSRQAWGDEGIYF
jgi:Carboxypeptidase regulatory-like domain